MVGPLGALPAGPAAATTVVEEDVDDGPPGERCRLIQQRPPPRLKRTLMTGPWRVMSAGLTASTIEVEEDVDGGPPDGDPRALTINIKKHRRQAL
jgi:hypothetical protein